MADRQRTILVIDDDAALRELLTEVLTDEGWTVTAAADGVAALALLESWRPDLIVLDHVMPRMDGPAFRSAQRARRDLAAIPVLLLSAARDLRAEGDSLGVAAVMPKPFDLDALVATVDRLLAEQESAAARRPRTFTLSLL